MSSQQEIGTSTGDGASFEAESSVPKTDEHVSKRVRASDKEAKNPAGGDVDGKVDQISMFGEADASQNVVCIDGSRHDAGEPEPVAASSRALVREKRAVGADVAHQSDGTSCGSHDAAICAPEMPTASIGAKILVPFGSLSIADDNIWSTDVADEEAVRRLMAVAATPGDIEPMLVVKNGNGWAIVSDPAAYLIIEKVHADSQDRLSLAIPVRQIEGSKAGIVFQAALQALGGRRVRNMRRARLALAVCETEGLQNKVVASRLGLDGGGMSRDLKAARMEREYSALALILLNPSEAPVSYYLDIRDHADRQASPDKAMASLVSKAQRISKAGTQFSPALAKQALFVSKRPARRAADAVEESLALSSNGHAKSAILEQLTGGELRLTLTFANGGEALDVHAVALENWLKATNPIEGVAS